MKVPLLFSSAPLARWEIDEAPILLSTLEGKSDNIPSIYIYIYILGMLSDLPSRVLNSIGASSSESVLG